MPDHDKTFGASGTPLSSLSGGALRALGGRENIKTAEEIARALSPQPQPIDPALLSFLFFTNLAAESSKPGATALGAAGTAALTPAKYLMQQREQQRKAEEQLPQTALNIAKLIKPPTGTGRGEKYVKTEPVVGEDGKIKRIEGAPVYLYRVEDSQGNLIRTVEMPDLSSAASVKPVPFFREDGASRLFTPGSQEYNQALQGEGDYIFASPPKTSSKITVVDKTKVDDPNTAIDERLIKINPLNYDSDIHAPKEAIPKETVAKRIENERAVYLTEEDAKKKLADLGVEPTDTEYETLLNQITTTDPERVGKPVILGQQYVSYFTPRPGSTDLTTILRTPMGSPVPIEVATLQKDLININKKIGDLRQTEADLLPNLDTAMSILLENPNATGILKGTFLDASRFFQEVLGLDPGTTDETVLLEALSNRLAPKMRAPGSGSTSDIEFEAYKRAILSLTNTGLANYIALYSLARQTRNNVDNISLIKELKKQFLSESEINRRVREQDKGIYEKWDVDLENPMFNTDSEETNTVNFIKARDNWFNSLNTGDVILNRVPGNPSQKLYPDAGTFIVKGWGGNN